MRGRTGTPAKLLPPAEERGLALLPRPSEGDVFYDIEGDPFYEAARGLEYLHGVIADGEFRAFWARSREEEQRAFEQLVDFLTERLARYPDLHVYHYAHYESAVLRRLAGEYGTREEEVDELLRREVFVDLYRVVAQSLRISHPRYGLKQVETFFMPARTEDVSAGDDSILVFEQWLDTGDDALLEAIERYNEFDCRATEALRDWLLERRAEAGIEAWKEPKAPREIPEERAEAIAEREALRQALLDGAEEGDERWLRRSCSSTTGARPGRSGGTTSGGSSRPRRSCATGTARRSRGSSRRRRRRSRTRSRSCSRSRFPTQQHKLAPGDVVDPATEANEQIVEIDEGADCCGCARAEARRRAAAASADPRAARGTRARSEARSRGSRRTRAATRRCARSSAATSRAATRATLFIQGPPGSGKTYGRRSSSPSCFATGCASASRRRATRRSTTCSTRSRRRRAPRRALKKCTAGDPDTRYDGKWIENEDDIAPFQDEEVRLLAGTAWLFAREELDGTLDYLVIDEAGQVSLADALAMGTSARNLVLARRPAPARAGVAGRPPGGTGCSVLEHLLGDDSTVPPERGIFLERTRRMHPDVCRFVSEVVYDGRLLPLEGLERQSPRRRRRGHPLGCRSSTPAVRSRRRRRRTRSRREIERLVGRRTRRPTARTRALRHEDVMVVAPYNAQVRCLRARLPASRCAVGTVDKFQGQEAPVVFYSTTSSSGDEVPRGLEFLFSRNRLNVAISRAQCLAVLVGSPRLLDVRTRSVEQMRLVNALCRPPPPAGSPGAGGREAHATPLPPVYPSP